jgi:3-phenylpropionate/trans-cinnamate dioxygenase ferredoxin component
MPFVDVARTGDIPRGDKRSFNVSGQPIMIVNLYGKFYALRNKCTHAGGDLSKGVLEGKVVTCPRHGSQFDVTNGKNLRGPKIGMVRLHTGDVQAYELKVEGDAIKVNI